MKHKTILLELTTDADLSEMALYSASEQLLQHRIGQAVFPTFSYYVLRVPSQVMGQAVFLSNSVGATLEISPTYEPDEWSLEERYAVDGVLRSVVVHSNGA